MFGIAPNCLNRFFKPEEEWYLPFYPLSLVEVSGSPRFELAYGFELFGMISICIVIHAVDFTIISVIAQLGAQLKVLQLSMRY